MNLNFIVSKNSSLSISLSASDKSSFSVVCGFLPAVGQDKLVKATQISPNMLVWHIKAKMWLANFDRSRNNPKFWQCERKQMFQQQPQAENEWMYECMNVWMYECMNVWMYECMNVWMYECMKFIWPWSLTTTTTYYKWFLYYIQQVKKLQFRELHAHPIHRCLCMVSDNWHSKWPKWPDWRGGHIIGRTVLT